MVDSPVRTSAEAIPVSIAIWMSVINRSPTMRARLTSTWESPSAASSISAEGLPSVTWHLVPVHASMAAVIAAQSGSPRPPGKGQNRSGLVWIRNARLWNQMASKAICSLR